MEENKKNKVRELGSIIQTTFLYLNDLTKKVYKLNQTLNILMNDYK